MTPCKIVTEEHLQVLVMRFITAWAHYQPFFRCQLCGKQRSGPVIKLKTYQITFATDGSQMLNFINSL